MFRSAIEALAAFWNALSNKVEMYSCKPPKTRLGAASGPRLMTIYMLVSHVVKMSHQHVKLMRIIKSRLRRTPLSLPQTSKTVFNLVFFFFFFSIPAERGHRPALFGYPAGHQEG